MLPTVRQLAVRLGKRKAALRVCGWVVAGGGKHTHTKKGGGGAFNIPGLYSSSAGTVWLRARFSFSSSFSPFFLYTNLFSITSWFLSTFRILFLFYFFLFSIPPYGRGCRSTKAGIVSGFWYYSFVVARFSLTLVRCVQKTTPSQHFTPCNHVPLTTMDCLYPSSGRNSFLLFFVLFDSSGFLVLIVQQIILEFFCRSYTTLAVQHSSPCCLRISNYRSPSSQMLRAWTILLTDYRSLSSAVNATNVWKSSFVMSTVFFLGGGGLYTNDPPTLPSSSPATLLSVLFCFVWKWHTPLAAKLGASTHRAAF